MRPEAGLYCPTKAIAAALAAGRGRSPDGQVWRHIGDGAARRALERRISLLASASRSPLVGGPGHAMLGVWETGTAPMTMRQHFALAATIEDVSRAPDILRAAGVEPDGEPIVYGWMPALAVFCDDPDGHLVEYLAMLPEAPRPDLGVVSWETWCAAVDADR